MLHILLLILKILLWILLGIIGLVLLIILLVLFAPIHYRAGVKYDGKALVKAKVRFLFVSFGVNFSQEDKNLETALHIAGIRLGGGKSEKKSKSKSNSGLKQKSKKENTEKIVEKNIENDKLDAAVDNMATDSETADIVDTELEKELDAAFDISPEKDGKVTAEKTDVNLLEKKAEETDRKAAEEADIKAGEETTEEKVSLADRIKLFAAKVKNIWSKISPESVMDTIDKKNVEIEKKYKKLEKKANRFIKLWNLECTVKTKNYLKKYLLSLAKHIGPRRIRGYVHYGFGDPAKTGQITGYISLLPFVYQKNFSLQPDFYDKVMDVDIDIKGYFMLGYILRIALKPYFWQTIKVTRKVLAQNKEM
jgi:hypothetical protein